jgi:hypothetical protein
MRVVTALEAPQEARRHALNRALRSPCAFTLVGAVFLAIAGGCGGTSSSTEPKPSPPAAGSTAGGTAGDDSSVKPPGGVGGITAVTEGGASPVTGDASSGYGGETTSTSNEPTLGGDCSPPGALACAGNHQKLTLVCSAMGAWETHETCPSGQFCDSTPGPDVGICKAPSPDCAGRQPGDLFCSGTDVLQCDANAIAADVTEHCEGRCVEGKCAAASPCPENIVYSCNPNCPAGPDPAVPDCFELCPNAPAGLSPVLEIPEGHSSAIALPAVSAAAEPCACDQALGALAAVAFQLPVGSTRYWRITYPQGWTLRWYTNTLHLPPPRNEYACASAWPAGVSQTPGCAIVDADIEGRLWLATNTPTSEAATVLIEPVNARAGQCP